MQMIDIFLEKNLFISKKLCTFATLNNFYHEND